MADNFAFRNEMSTVKMVYLLFIIFMLLMLSWFSINQPKFAEASIWYFIFGSFGLLLWLIDFSIKRVGSEMISTSIWENSVFGKLSSRWYALIIAGSLGWSLFTFFNVVATKQSIIGAKLQIIELGITGNILTTAAFAITENLIFFYFIVPTIFGISYKTSGNAAIAAMTAVFIGGVIVFPTYHFLNYGLSDLSSTVGVATFGFINSLMVLLLRNPIFTDTWHVANNLGILIAKTAKVGLSVFGAS